ncbi:TetR/AcrR family transcriptional regulator [Demequina sp. NBRC 110054]|uniref:TetR/AcrR family transcriptional regulator n=1 Tax=Demequina sp. NBRC 110054 TaxID=1570343 RepID=UPI0013563D8C|nr:TetR/AcrR family transcriptional regulator [Demequina sp. NBRC 110054]
MGERLTPEVRRARILDTAMQILDSDGHRGLTLRAVARACDMTAPGLMHHFPTLDHLLVAVVERRDQRDEVEGEARLAGRITPRAIFDEMIEGILARPEAARLFAAVQADAIDPAHPGHAWFVHRYAREAEHFTALFGDRIPDAGGLARRCMAAIDGLQLQFLADPSFDLRGQWAAMADALLSPAE